jgi:hypothetical protein
MASNRDFRHVCLAGGMEIVADLWKTPLVGVSSALALP